MSSPSIPNDLSAYWMPFTANRAFKREPRMFSGAKGMYYTTPDGRRILDGMSGLWCVNTGHGREEIVAAIAQQAQEMDFAPPFQMGHPKAFELAARIADLAPGDLDHVFFANSGSEAVDTALKIALGYFNVSGQGTRTRLVGRVRGYNGVGFGGISVGGMVANRKTFGPMLTGVDHLPTTYNREKQAFTKGEPDWGAHLADELESIVGLHDASTIAAVIVEPMAGSTGALPAPKGYLQRLRQICDKYGILLIFDEVITGFGRLGYAFAAERYGVVPDMITFAKGVTAGSVPMGGVLVRKQIYDAFMKGPDYAVELFHGYTYSGHPLACAAGLATLDIYARENLFERARSIEDLWGDTFQALRGLPNVADIRTIGLVAAIDLDPSSVGAGKRGYDAIVEAYHKHDILLRNAGDTIVLAPSLIISQDEIAEAADKVSKVIRAVA